MPRKGQVAKRDVLPDPIHNSKLVTRLINKIMIDGKRGIAQNILYKAFKKIEEKYQQLDKSMTVFWNKYHEKLFKIDKPLAFEDSKNNRFMGIIQGVTHDGKLQVMLEDDSITFFNIKEIQMLY